MPRTRHRRVPFIVAWAVLTLALVGCGDDEPRGSPTATANTVLTIVTPTVDTAKEGGSETAGTQQRYVVQEGDTLSTIAARFGVTEEALQRANELSDPDAIFVGQELSIPAP